MLASGGVRSTSGAAYLTPKDYVMRLREIRCHVGEHVHVITSTASQYVGKLYRVSHDDTTGADRVDLAECFQIRPGDVCYHETKSLIASTVSEVRPL